jgi:hypothetical protein
VCCAHCSVEAVGEFGRLVDCSQQASLLETNNDSPLLERESGFEIFGDGARSLPASEDGVHSLFVNLL